MSLLDALLPSPVRDEAWPAVLPDHLSASSIGMFRRCPEQFRRRYLLGEKERPGAALVWGGADHEAHAFNFKQKIDTHVDVPVNDVMVAFAHFFDEKVDEHGGESEIAWGDDKPGPLKDAGVQLVAAYHERVSPAIQPTCVERKFDVRVPNVPVPVVGFIDLETDPLVIERKTAKRAEKSLSPKWAYQSRLYQLVTARPVHVHVSVKTKTPQILTPEEEPGLELPLTPSYARVAGKLIETVAAQIVACLERYGSDDPWPDALSHPWSCQFCGYRPTCFYWGAS